MWVWVWASVRVHSTQVSARAQVLELPCEYSEYPWEYSEYPL